MAVAAGWTVRVGRAWHRQVLLVTSDADRMGELAERVAEDGCMVVACEPERVGDALRVARFGAVLVIGELPPGEMERLSDACAAAPAMRGVAIVRRDDVSASGFHWVDGHPGRGAGTDPGMTSVMDRTGTARRPRP